MLRYLRARLLSALSLAPWLLMPLIPILAFALWLCGIG
jgi:hypothetical protein